MSVKDMLKKLIPGYTDKKVTEINKQSLKRIEESAVAAKRLASRRRDSISMMIIIALGGDNND